MPEESGKPEVKQQNGILTTKWHLEAIKWFLKFVTLEETMLVTRTHTFESAVTQKIAQRHELQLVWTTIYLEAPETRVIHEHSCCSNRF